LDQYNVFEIHPYCGRYYHLLFVFGAFCRVKTSLKRLVYEHLICLQFGNIINKFIINTLIKMFVWTHVYNSLGSKIQNDPSGTMLLTYVDRKSPNFFKVALPFCIFT
jgi:hypothetical protein